MKYYFLIKGYKDMAKRVFRPRMKKQRKVTRPKRLFQGVSRPLKNYIKRAIGQKMENKTVLGYAANQSITTASSTTPFTIQNLLPALSIGTGVSNRVGNEVRVKSAYVSGYINLLPYNAVTNPLSTPIIVKMWLCSSKTINTNLISNTSIATDFFEINNGSVGFQGNMLDMILTPNKDNWTVLQTRKFELGATTATNNGQVGTGGYFDSSKMTKPFYFNYGKHFKNALKYNDSLTNVPTNRNLFLVVQAVNADGSSTAVNVAECHYQFRVNFEDA